MRAVNYSCVMELELALLTPLTFLPAECLCFLSSLLLLFANLFNVVPSYYSISLSLHKILIDCVKLNVYEDSQSSRNVSQNLLHSIFFLVFEDVLSLPQVTSSES